MGFDLFSDENLWIFGMMLNVVGSVGVNFGTNVMKSSHNIAAAEADTINKESNNIDADVLSRHHGDSLRPDYVWKLGMLAFVTGSLVNFVSFAFAAQSLLACLGTVQFVSNVFFAKVVLKETLTPRIIYATGIIIFGLTLAILYSNHTTMTYSAEDLFALYTAKYALFMLGVIVVLVSLQCVFMYYVSSEAKGIKLLGHRLVVPCCYALVSAIIGAQSVLQSKCMAELLKATIAGDNQLTNGFTYVIILAFVFGISFWLYRMNSALKQFEGLIIIPLLQVFWTTSAIIQGGMYFQEFERFTTSQIVGFSSGVAIVFIGVYMLAPTDKETVIGDCVESDGTVSSHMNQSLHPIGPPSISIAVSKKSRNSITSKVAVVNGTALEGVTSSLANSVNRAGSKLSSLASHVIHNKGTNPFYEIALDDSRNRDNFSRTDTAMDISNRSDISDLSNTSAAVAAFVNPLHYHSPSTKTTAKTYK